MTKAIKAQAMLAANPSISNGDFVKLLMSELGMSLAGARTYSYNARNPKGTKATKATKAKKAPSERQLKTRLKVEKAQAKAQFGSKSIDEIAAIKEANLARMKTVSAKLRPFRDRLDEVIIDRNPEFDPQEAREEVQAILEAEGYKDRPQMFD